MALAIRESVTPARLLNQWRSEGWTLERQEVVRQIPGDDLGRPTVALQLDAFEWIDVTFVGLGAVDDAVARMRDYIRAAGSDLWAYALFSRTDVDVLGLKVVRHRLLLNHSIVQLLGAAVLILATVFAAVVFWQYVTTGQAPALADMQALWGSAVSSVGKAAGDVGASVTNAYWGWVIGLGVVATSFAVIAKQAGVRAPRTPGPPGGSLGVRAGPLSGRVSA